LNCGRLPRALCCLWSFASVAYCTVDKDRQIRLLIPPFFLLASVLWGAYLSGDLGAFLHPTGDGAATLKSILSIVAVAGVATLPLGYAIGVLTITILSIFSRLFPQHAFDVPVSDAAMKAIWKKLGLSEQPRDRARYGTAVFDHYLLKTPVHQWLFRRWSAFLIASQCAFALALSIPFAHALHVHMTRKWLFTVLLVIAVFIWHARVTWREAYKMFDLVTSTDSLTHEHTASNSRSSSHSHSCPC